MNLTDEIAQVLQAEPGLSARQIVAKLRRRTEFAAITKSDVNSSLYSSNRFSKDGATPPLWYPRSALGTAPSRAAKKAPVKKAAKRAAARPEARASTGSTKKVAKRTSAGHRVESAKAPTGTASASRTQQDMLRTFMSSSRQAERTRVRLDELRLQNFKSIGGHELTTIPLAPITLIFGPNSSGKSSLVQSLLLLKQTSESWDPRRTSPIIRGPLVDLGSFSAMVHSHDIGLPVVSGFTYTAELERMTFDPVPGRTRTIDFEIAWDEAAAAVRLRRALLHVADGKRAVFSRVHEADGDFTTSGGAEHRAFFEVDDHEPRSFAEFVKSIAASARSDGSQELLDALSRAEAAASATAERGWTPRFEGRSLVPGQVVGFADEDGTLVEPPGADDLRSVWTWLSLRLQEELAALFSSVAYLGPLRQAPERIHVLSGAYHADVGSTGEHAAEVLHHNRGVLDSVNSWLDRLEVPYKVDIRRTGLQAEGSGTAGDIVSLVLFDRRSQTLVSPSDVGFGISQLLPIVVQACIPGPAILVVEQPEIHLHPRLQAELGDLVLDSASGPSGKQLIVETHSEHLMLRLQRRIRRGEVSPDHISVLYVDVPEGSTTAEVTRIRLDSDGDFVDEWPSGFFDERLKEVLD